METGESLLAPELVRRHRKALHAEAKGVAARRAATAGELCGRQFGPRSCTAGGDGTARDGAGETVRFPDERGPLRRTWPSGRTRAFRGRRA